MMIVDSSATTGFPEDTAFLTCSLTRTNELIYRFGRIILHARRVDRIIEDRFCKFPRQSPMSIFEATPGDSIQSMEGVVVSLGSPHHNIYNFRH